MSFRKNVFLCLFLALSVFAFAGANQAPNQAAGNVKTTINVSAWDVGTDASVSFYLQLKAAFEGLNPNIQVAYLDTPSPDYTQKLTIMLNGGSDVDAMWVKDGDTTSAYAQRGQLADLSPYLKRDNIALSLYPGIADMTMGGKIIGLPVRRDYYVLFYNKDIFDKMGVPYPGNDMTWSDWESLCARLSSGSGTDRIYGGLLHTWNACVQNWGIQDGKNTIMATDYSFFKPYYEMALRLQKAGYIWDYGSLVAGSISYNNVFFQGNAATVPMGTWLIAGTIKAQNTGAAKFKNWGVATLPHPDGVPSGYTVGSMTPVSINQASKKKDAAWEYIKFITGDQGATMFAQQGFIPGRQTPDILTTISKLPGMPQGIADALAVKNVSLDRPYDPLSAQVNQMLGEEHSLIMLGQVSVDQGLAEMAKRSKEIQGK